VACLLSDSSHPRDNPYVMDQRETQCSRIRSSVTEGAIVFFDCVCSLMSDISKNLMGGVNMAFVSTEKGE
jgi:hypothetical protein